MDAPSGLFFSSEACYGVFVCVSLSCKDMYGVLYFCFFLNQTRLLSKINTGCNGKLPKWEIKPTCLPLLITGYQKAPVIKAVIQGPQRDISLAKDSLC